MYIYTKTQCLCTSVGLFLVLKFIVIHFATIGNCLANLIYHWLPLELIILWAPWVCPCAVGSVRVILYAPAYGTFRKELNRCTAIN